MRLTGSFFEMDKEKEKLLEQARDKEELLKRLKDKLSFANSDNLINFLKRAIKKEEQEFKRLVMQFEKDGSIYSSREKF